MDKEYGKVSAEYKKLFVITDDPNKEKGIISRMMRKGKVYTAKLETGEVLFVAEKAAYTNTAGDIFPGLRELQ